MTRSAERVSNEVTGYTVISLLGGILQGIGAYIEFSFGVALMILGLSISISFALIAFYLHRAIERMNDGAHTPTLTKEITNVTRQTDKRKH